MRLHSQNRREDVGSKGFTLVEIMIVSGIMAIIVAIAIPTWVRARSQSRMKSCQENLTKIDGAKEQWAIEQKHKSGVVPSVSDLVDDPGVTQSFLRYMPKEPSGGSYVINAIGVDPTCTTGYPGHSMSELGTLVTSTE